MPWIDLNKIISVNIKKRMVQVLCKEVSPICMIISYNGIICRDCMCCPLVWLKEQLYVSFGWCYL